MQKCFLSLGVVVLLPACAYGIDGQILISQATVLAAGGFPYKITQSGSYKLSGNLIVTNTDAIDISAANVTLDLNGFTISCTGCQYLAGVEAGINSSAQNTTVRNGVITGFVNNAGTGVVPTYTNNAGIFLSADGGKVDSVTITGSTSGVLVGTMNYLPYGNPSLNIAISNSILSANSVGVYANGSVTVTNCQFNYNLFGALLSRAHVTGSTFSGQQNTALAAYAETMITNNFFVGNLAAIEAAGGNVVIYGLNVLQGNTYEFLVAGRSMSNNFCRSGTC